MHPDDESRLSSDSALGANLEVRAKRRPFAITVIALLEFARAAIVIVVATCILLFPSLNLSTRTDVKVLTYIVAGQNLPSSIMAPIVLPFIAATLVALGLGLWFLKKWARNLLMIGSGGVVVLWVRRLLLDSAIGHLTLQTEMQRETVYAVILLDALIFSSLAFLPDVPEAFS